ncbi:hypothetical protein IKE13_03160, partial [Candidatus Saccharibacteria bacterium]|nr:hypothetical protein [Candidatus Saccharibacteria bacterium]
SICNDNNGFAIYAAGYTNDEIGGENSNKLVGTTTNISTGLATSGATSTWAMKLTKTSDSGDTTGSNAFTIDSAPNEGEATPASFSDYHTVPNEYVKVAHKTAATSMDTTTGGATLQTTYRAYISPTQPAGTYNGKVIYTLVHPSDASAPVHPDQIGVNYNANGSSFTGGNTTNNVVYAMNPMYIATEPLISKTDNIGDDGIQNGSYQTTAGVPVPITATGATKMKVVIRYGFSEGTMMPIIEGNWDGSSQPGNYEMIQGPATGTATYIFNGDAVTFFMKAESAPSATDGQDYGYFAEVYPIYTTEQPNTEASSEFTSLTVDTGTYATTTNWYGSWYADINNVHYDFIDEAEVISFLENNISTLSGTTIDLMRGLTFDEAYTRANKTQDNGYYKQQELTKSMCNTIAITQNQTLKDTRDNSTYMVGKLKDGNCWMLDNLALDPTDSTTAQNLNAGNTNATNEAITNYLNGGNSNNTTGWSTVAVADVDTDFVSYTAPMINNASKDTLVTSYGPASTNGQAKVGIYYNFCAATVGTYCYEYGQGVDVPSTNIDANQDLCPANWRMPTGGLTGEYLALYNKYITTMDATNVASLQYNLSTPLSGHFNGSSASTQNGWGEWWSSTYLGFSDMQHILNVRPTRVGPNDGANRDDGRSMRCLVGE